MIDMHCHILPGVDDGAENAQVSLTMAEAREAFSELEKEFEREIAESLRKTRNLS